MAVHMNRPDAAREKLTPVSFGRFVREERRRQGLSLHALMHMMHYTNNISNFSKLERGEYKSGPTLGTCVMVLDTLGYEFRIVRKQQE